MLGNHVLADGAPGCCLGLIGESICGGFQGLAFPLIDLTYINLPVGSVHVNPVSSGFGKCFWA